MAINANRVGPAAAAPQLHSHRLRSATEGGGTSCGPRNQMALIEVQSDSAAGQNVRAEQSCALPQSNIRLLLVEFKMIACGKVLKLSGSQARFSR